MRRGLAVLACVGLAAATCAQDGGPVDAGQSEQDRIAALEARVAELVQERDALRVRLAEAIEMLRNLGYSAPDPVLAEPNDPLASPLAAMQTLRRRARLELGSLPRESEADRAAYRRAAQAWVDRMNEGLAGERRWLVRVLSVEMPTSGSSAARAAARVQLFDAATGSALSMPIEVAVPSRVGRRMAEAGSDQGWTAHVVLEPMVRHNPDRLERGPFDFPPFLAPEVEARVGVDWVRFEPAEVPDGFFPPLPGEDELVAPGSGASGGAGAGSGGVEPGRQPR